MGSRGLTEGEINLAKLVFKEAINYAKIKIHDRRFISLDCFQSGKCAVTVLGNIYYPKQCFKDDFSVSTESDKTWFIHEMVHVWQYQLGAPIHTCAVALYCTGKYLTGSAYKYDVSQKFSDYNIEQQAEIISDYFQCKFLYNNENTEEILSKIEPVLKEFIENPGNKSLLPTIRP